MIEIKGSKKEAAVREWFNKEHDGKVPMDQKVVDLFDVFKKEHPNISYGCLNGTMKKIIAEGHSDVTEDFKPEEVDVEILAIDEMEFPDFKLLRSGKKLDDLFSDHEEGGGLYGGTVNIVVGESGVGKSTVLLDHLASVVKENPDARVLYISSEMTRNDIQFYYKKSPSIAKVPTLLLMDYVKSGQLDQVLMKTFSQGWDVILVDSHQDILVKLKEVKGWRATKAESWLTNMMIDAAENHGCAVLAIQHMTKGGQYVGSTYLKHATTSMMEICFDETGQRYIEFSKNRRGGSGVGKRLYYRLKDGEVVYDEQRFKETEELSLIENQEADRRVDLSSKFEEVFLSGKKRAEQAEEEDAATEVPLEVVTGGEE
jgi:archaellum biogenesis ATPase FlaH